MSNRPSPAFVASLLALSVLFASPAGALAAKPAKKMKHPRVTVFEVCKRGCRYGGIQRAVDAAGAYSWRHDGAEVKVAVRPGRYAEGVVVDGTRRREDFDGMTIVGTKPDRRRAILEGAGSGRGARNGIEAIGVAGLTLKNLWARNFESNGVLVRAAGEVGGGCEGFAMANLLASGNGAHGIAAEGCLGGRITGSAAFRQGDSGFSIGATPCDSPRWSVYGEVPCQATPRWTLLKDDESYENAVGYAGPDAKYVLVLENAFFDNGAGIVAGTLDGGGVEPNGWNVIERNDAFWNNYNPYLAWSTSAPAAAGLGELNGRKLAYPTGVGIALAGSDHSVVRANHVFGNYKWGIASFSLPGETLVADAGDEARSVGNEVVENFLGRGGADPNGEYDIWNDASGGGNCWGANGPNSTFAPGNGKLPPTQIYPVCPPSPIAYATAKSFNDVAGLQTSPIEPADPATILGYLSTDPPQDQQCSWFRRATPHPDFQTFEAVEVEPRAGEVDCSER